MTGAIKDSVSNSGRLIRIPRHRQALVKSLREGHAHHSNTRFLRVDEVGVLKGVDSEISQAAQIASLPALSLSFGPDARDLGLKDREVSGEPVDALIAREAQDQLHHALGRLSNQDKRIAELRFGLNGIEEKTFKEIGEVMGFSEAHACRKVAAIIRKLRSILAY